VTPELLAKIAKEYATGRAQQIATTDLDAGRQVTWNMGAIASSSSVSFPSNVISALRTLETGQVFSASLARRVNVVSSIFGTLARNDRAERLMRKP